MPVSYCLGFLIIFHISEFHPLKQLSSHQKKLATCFFTIFFYIPKFCPLKQLSFEKTLPASCFFHFFIALQTFLDHIKKTCLLFSCFSSHSRCLRTVSTRLTCILSTLFLSITFKIHNTTFKSFFSQNHVTFLVSVNNFQMPVLALVLTLLSTILMSQVSIHECVSVRLQATLARI